MLIRDLFKEILLNPATRGADELFAVSGYASATFARRHLKAALEINKDLKIWLIVGMPMNRVEHGAFLHLHNEFAGSFHGYYFRHTPPVHSKVFSWFDAGEPMEAYTGSANYSQPGFFEDRQINQMVEDDPQQVKDFYDSLLPDSVFMPEVQLEDLPVIRIPQIQGSVGAGEMEWLEPDKSVRISFLERGGTLPGRSGLNWGQRQEKRIDPLTGAESFIQREPNQAYLSLKGDARREGFLPPLAFTFTLATDDGETFDCVVAQEGRKAIHSTNDNSELGIYFRRRLGLAPGALISVEDLERYGRTDYVISKVDDENFLLDFSKPN